MAMIKRFKEILEGDLSLFEKAASLASQDFEMNEEKTQIRYIKKAEAPVVEEEVKVDRNAAALMSHMELQNKRSIYAVSNPEINTTRIEIDGFFFFLS